MAPAGCALCGVGRLFQTGVLGPRNLGGRVRVSHLLPLEDLNFPC